MPVINNFIAPTAGKFYDDGYLRIEYDNYFVSCDGKRIKMPKAEFMILSRLSQEPERIVSYQELWKSIWGDCKPVSTESLKVYIYNLRRLLNPFEISIETLINVGYRIIFPNKNLN